MDYEGFVGFLKKAYAMVDDPSTDSVISWSQDGKSFIVWHPAECCRNHLPRLLGIKDFARFEANGFRKNKSSGLLEYAKDDFVRGKPELLDKIGERWMADLKASNEPNVKRIREIRECKNREERHLVIEEYNEKWNREKRERREKAFAKSFDGLMKRIAKERETREDGVLSKDVEDRVLRVNQLLGLADQISS